MNYVEVAKQILNQAIGPMRECDKELTVQTIAGIIKRNDVRNNDTKRPTTKKSKSTARSGRTARNGSIKK